MADLKRMNVRVRQEMHEWFSKMAESRGLTLNAMVIFALETYMQQQTMMPLMPEMLKALENDLKK